jgi:uncharacterized membrane protein (DUF4010 family)
MTTSETFARLGLALAIGLLIGIERGWQEREGKPGSRAAGIRTHALIALLGGVWALLAHLAAPVVLGFAAVGFAGAFAWYDWNETHAAGSYSATGFVAGLLSFALGAYAVLGDKFAAGSAAVAATVILAERRVLHAFLERLKWTELRAALLLLVMSVVLLPVIPDRTVDPWNALNPFQIWLMTILIATISYAGYIAVRLAGTQNGLLLAGAIGGLISSTTVSWTFARQERLAPGAQGEFLSGILASWAVSLVRVLVVVTVLAPALAVGLAAPLAAGALVCVAGTAVAYRFARGQPQASSLAFEDPFDIFVVLQFAVLLTLIILATKWLQAAFGQPGLLALASISGLADVDPIILSVSKAVGHAVSTGDARLAILVACGANLVAKCALAFTYGTARFGAILTAIAVAAVVAAAAAFAGGVASPI